MRRYRKRKSIDEFIILISSNFLSSRRKPDPGPRDKAMAISISIPPSLGPAFAGMTNFGCYIFDKLKSLSRLDQQYVVVDASITTKCGQ
jgi:hypothetical protein